MFASRVILAVIVLLALGMFTIALLADKAVRLALVFRRERRFAGEAQLADGKAVQAAETFNEIGAAIKANSPARHTLFVGVGNGCIGYLPTAAAHREGGYEVEQAPLAYRMSGTFDPGCEALVVQRSLDAVRRVLG